MTSECRQISSMMEFQDRRRIREALSEDTREISNILREIVCSESGKSLALRLTGENADTFMNLIQTVHTLLFPFHALSLHGFPDDDRHFTVIRCGVGRIDTFIVMLIDYWSSFLRPAICSRPLYLSRESTVPRRKQHPGVVLQIFSKPDIAAEALP